MQPSPVRPIQPLRAAGIAALILSVPAVFLVKAMVARGVSPGVAVLTEGLPWYAWAVMTPAILALVRRFPLDRPPRVHAFGLHLLFGLTAGLLQGSVSACIITAVDLPEELVGQFTVGSVILIWIPFGLIMYGAIAAIGSALDYRARLAERELAADRLERLLVETRLGALRMQLQPHFLFNALNTIAMLVRQGDGATAVRVIARFGELLRHVLDEEAAPEVTLGEELELVGRYLDIERVRFGDRLCVDVRADDAARAVPVPHLLLQPIVENAVRHGVSRRAGAGHVEIEARVSAGRLHVTVRDDGPGLPPVWTPARAQGIGLRNTRERLHCIHGDAASLDIGPAAGSGVQVTIVLPANGRIANV